MFRPERIIARQATSPGMVATTPAGTLELR
jgi:hypothetical protein